MTASSVEQVATGASVSAGNDGGVWKGRRWGMGALTAAVGVGVAGALVL